MVIDFDFAQRLTDARKKANLSQTQLAKACNISRQAIYDYEKGKFLPKYETAKRLAEALAIDVNFLYYGRLPAELTYKDLLTQYLGIMESHLFTEEISGRENKKKVTLTTEDPDFIRFLCELKNILSIQGVLNRNTANKVIQELLNSYDIPISKTSK